MEYIIAVDGKYRHRCGSSLPTGAIEVKKWEGMPGEPVDYYDEKGSRYTDEELLEKGILEDHRGTYYDSDHQLHQVEKIGAKPDESWTKEAPGHWSDKLENGSWVPNQETRDKETRETEIRKLEAYLSSTDWYVIRKQETGKETPEEIITARSSARTRISELREEVC